MIIVDARQRHAQRGFSSSVQYAVLTPLLMLTLLGTIQVGVWWHAQDVVAQAARLACDEARGSRPDLAAAQADAEALARDAGLEDVQVEVRRGPARVEVDVSSRAVTFVDLGLPRLQGHASAPVERVTGP